MRYGFWLVFWTVMACATAAMLWLDIRAARIFSAYANAACVLMSLCFIGFYLWELHQRLGEDA